MYHITQELYFPPVETASAEGILAFGGDLSPERLLLAYRSGIFPWFEADEPILWWAPPKRMVLFPEEFKASKSMRNILNRGLFTVTFNQDFKAVITHCQKVKRNGQIGTWITDSMVQAYLQLNELGYAQSIEVWQNQELVGGLYGIDMGHVFCGESMFSLMPNASKVAFVSLVNYLKENGYLMLDAQVHNEHLESLGCQEIPRADFMKILKR